MAITWNKIIPRWGGDTIEPPEAKKDTGYIAGDKPPAKWENWLRKGTYEALDETRDVIEGIDSQLAQDALDLATHKKQNVSQNLFASRDTSLSGVQIITGLNQGKVPKRIEIICNTNSIEFLSTSFGAWEKNGDAQMSQRIFKASTGAVANRFSTSTAVGAQANESNFINGTVQNVTDTSFEINWVKSGTITGTIYLHIIAHYH